MSAYTGPVCYQDGWHWSVAKDKAGGDVPDKRLFLEDNGSYRLATAKDESWHDRKHQRFATVTMEDASPGLRVSPEEFDAIQQMLRERRGE